MSEVEGGSSVSAGWWQTQKLLGPEAAGRASSTLSGPGFLPRHGNACAWALQLLPLGQRQWLELVACPCLGVRTTVAAGEPGRWAGPRGHQHCARGEEPAGLWGPARQPFWLSESTPSPWGRSVGMMGLGQGHPPSSVLHLQQTFATTSLPLAGSRGHGASGVLLSWLVWGGSRAGENPGGPGRRKASLCGCLRGSGPCGPHPCSLLPSRRPLKYMHLTAAHFHPTQAPRIWLPHRCSLLPRAGPPGPLTSQQLPPGPVSLPSGKETIPASPTGTSPMLRT